MKHEAMPDEERRSMISKPKLKSAGYCNAKSEVVGLD
jgi:hypothetical protein